jgi:hypothetical protein
MRRRNPAFAHAAFQQVAHAQFAADLADVDGLALVGEAGVAGDHEQCGNARESRGDVFGDAVSEVLLLAITTHVLEGQDGDRRLVGQGEGRCARFGMPRRGRSCRLPIGFVPLHPESPYGPFDVLESEFAQGVEPRPEATLDRFAHRTRDNDPARWRFGLQASRDVHAIAVEIVAIDDQVAKVEANAEGDLFCFEASLVGLGDGLLEFDRC